MFSEVELFAKNRKIEMFPKIEFFLLKMFGEKLLVKIDILTMISPKFSIGHFSIFTKPLIFPTHIFHI